MGTVTGRLLGRAGTAVAVAALVLWLLARCSTSSVEPGDGRGTGVGDPVTGAASLRISGRTTGTLFPGASVPVDLELTNSFGYSMWVGRLTVSIGEVSAPRSDATHPCTKRDFAVRQVPAELRLTVPARATSSLMELGIRTTDWPEVSMLNTSVNQDGCQGASVGLDYRGAATTVLP
jgi:hypothetical protein